MKAIENYEEIKATSGEFERPGAGGYCIEILDVKDVPFDPFTGKGAYLKIEYDICQGEFKGYYTKQNDRFGGAWFASFVKSYKEKALGMFKHFTNCIEESNVGYKWDWNERGLIGKFVGAVMQEEEYLKKDGSVGVRLIVKEIKTCKQIIDGDYKIPALKKLNTTTISQTLPQRYEEIESMDDLPFN